VRDSPPPIGDEPVTNERSRGSRAGSAPRGQGPHLVSTSLSRIFPPKSREWTLSDGRASLAAGARGYGLRQDMATSFLRRVLQEPGYGWSRDGELYRPTAGEIMREWLSRMNLFANRKAPG
jgi:hypothetical protein